MKIDRKCLEMTMHHVIIWLELGKKHLTLTLRHRVIFLQEVR